MVPDGADPNALLENFISAADPQDTLAKRSLTPPAGTGQKKAILAIIELWNIAQLDFGLKQVRLLNRTQCREACRHIKSNPGTCACAGQMIHKTSASSHCTAYCSMQEAFMQLAFCQRIVCRTLASEAQLNITKLVAALAGKFLAATGFPMASKLASQRRHWCHSFCSQPGTILLEFIIIS